MFVCCTEPALETITGHNVLSAAALHRLSDVHEDISSTMKREAAAAAGHDGAERCDITAEKDEQS